MRIFDKNFAKLQLQYVKRRKGTTVIVTHETIFDAIADNIYYMEI